MSFNLLAGPGSPAAGDIEAPTGETLEKEATTISAGHAPAIAEADEETVASASIAATETAPAPESSAIAAQERDTAAASSNSDSDKDDGDDDEDWAEVAKGRYFGDPDDAATTDAQRCHNCKGTGHKRKNCPHSLCRTCGALDDHDTVRCPLTQRCFNCARLGHLASACPEPPRQSGSYCKDCGSRSHLSRSCPQIWRLYHPDARFDAEGDWQVQPYCYNCAEQGHYGDDCALPHRVRLIEPSAFCVANEPETSRRRKHVPQQQHRHDMNGHGHGDRPSSGSSGSSYQQHHGQSYTQQHDGHGRRDGRDSRDAAHTHRFDPYKRPEIISDRQRPSKSRGQQRASTWQQEHPSRRDRDRSREHGGGGRAQRGGKPYRGGMFANRKR